MGEPIKKTSRTPESYNPKKPELAGLLKEAQQESKLQEKTIIQPEIIAKRFLLVGFEAAIDLNESHWQGMDCVKSALKTSLDKIGSMIRPARFIGMWEADPDADYSKPQNHSKRLYFYGVEVLNLDSIPTDCVIKDLPESIYAVFKESEHGSPKYDWLNAAGYVPDRDFQRKYALDMEIYDAIDGAGAEWDVVIPIKSGIRGM